MLKKRKTKFSGSSLWEYVSCFGKGLTVWLSARNAH